MRKQKDIEDVIKMIYNYRSFLITKEKLHRNLFKKFRLSELSGFLYGLHYCLGYMTPIQSSFQLYDLFPEQISEFYYDTLSNRVNNIQNPPSETNKE